MRINNLLNRMRMRGVYLSLAAGLLVIALIAAAVVFGMDMLKPKAARIQAQFADALRSGDLSRIEALVTTEEEEQKTVQALFRDTDPELLKTFFQTLKVEENGKEQTLSEGRSRFPLKLSTMDPQLFSENLKTILDSVQTEIKDAPEKAKDAERAIQKELLTLSKPEDHRKSTESELLVDKSSGEWKIDGKSQAFLDLLAMAKTATEKQREAWMNLKEQAKNAASLPSTTGTTESEAEQSRASSVVPSSEKKTLTSLSEGNSASKKEAFGQESVRPSEDESNEKNNEPGEVASAPEESPGQAASRSENAPEAGEETPTEGDAAETNAAVSSSVAESVKATTSDTPRPGGYWIVSSSDTLLSIARTVYADDPDCDLYVYRIIEENQLSEENGTYYLYQGQALYLPLP